MAHDDAANAPESPAAIDCSEQSAPMPESARSPRMQPLLDEIKQGFPVSAQPLLLAGVRRAADFLDIAYAKAYLQPMLDIHALDARFGCQEKNWALTNAAAHHIAIAINRNAVIRSAHLKTHPKRFKQDTG